MTADLTPKVFPGPAGSPGNLVAMENLRLRPDLLSPDLLSQRLRVEGGCVYGGEGPSQVVSQALQVVLMNLEVENHSPELLRRLGYRVGGTG